MSSTDARPPYVPIIKWQQYERSALAALEKPVADRILPCLEIRDSSQHDALIKHLATVWPRLVLVDYADPSGTLTASRFKELSTFLKQLPADDSSVIPVFGPPDVLRLGGTAVASILKKRHRVGLRLRTRQSGSDAAALAMIQQALQILGIAAESVVLLVDMGTTPTLTSNERSSFASFIAGCAALGFNMVTVASGAFPSDLQSIKGSKLIDRDDWVLWTSLVPLIPSVNIGFADYGILSPKWEEIQLTRRGGKATIKYALDNSWRIIRGTDKTKGQSIAISVLMTTVHQAEFRKKGYSHGDTMIADRVDPSLPLSKKKGGNAHITEAWTIHITYLVKAQY